MVLLLPTNIFVKYSLQSLVARPSVLAVIMTKYLEIINLEGVNLFWLMVS